MLQLPILFLYYLSNSVHFLSLKSFLEESNYSIAFLNLFDICFVSIIIGSQKILINSKFIEWIDIYLNNVYGSFQFLGIKENIITMIFICSLLLFLFLILPLCRSIVAIWLYKKHNSIRLSTEKVYWNIILMMGLLSFFSIILYLNLFFLGDYFDGVLGISIMTLIIFMSFNLISWFIIYDDLNKLGTEKDQVISGWIIFLLSLGMIVLYDLIDSVLIETLTWFLPILIPNFIGEINSQSRYPNRNHTPKMKKHLYWIQIVVFNTLFILNILSAIEDKYKNDIPHIEILVAKISFPPLIHSLIVSIVTVFISFLIAIGFSKLLIKSLKRYYLNPKRG